MIALVQIAACAGRRNDAAILRALRATEVDDRERRYYSVRSLSVMGDKHTRLRLLELTADADPLIRNAAARSLCDRGEKHAASALIDNLHRDRRTYVVTDAIYHLRLLFQTDLNYNPNLGYRHQTEKQDEWWAWWEQQTFGGKRPVQYLPDDDDDPEERARILRLLERFKEEGFANFLDEEAGISAMWTEVAPIARSRLPDNVAVVEAVFAEFTRRWFNNPDLWNNYALAALNNGQWDRALEAYRVALALRPEDASLHNDIGILFEGLGQLDDAAGSYKEAARLDPTNDIAFTNLGDVLAAMGDKRGALAQYSSAEKLAPEKWQYHRLWIKRLGLKPKDRMPPRAPAGKTNAAQTNAPTQKPK
ncbi:MAG: tetratricopeptide repeat protein [Planctomycetota bacterium]